MDVGCGYTRPCSRQLDGLATDRRVCVCVVTMLSKLCPYWWLVSGSGGARGASCRPQLCAPAAQLRLWCTWPRGSPASAVGDVMCVCTVPLLYYTISNELHPPASVFTGRCRPDCQVAERWGCWAVVCSSLHLLSKSARSAAMSCPLDGSAVLLPGFCVRMCVGSLAAGRLQASMAAVLHVTRSV